MFKYFQLNKFYLKITIISSFIFIANLVTAVGSVSSISSKNKSLVKHSVSGQLTNWSNFENTENYNYESGSSLSLSGNLSGYEHLNLSVNISVDKSWVDDREMYLNDISLANSFYNKNKINFYSFDLSPVLFLSLATSKVSRLLTSKVATIGTKLSFSRELNLFSTYISVKKFTLATSLSNTFYQKQTTLQGTSNNHLVFANTLSFSGVTGVNRLSWGISLMVDSKMNYDYRISNHFNFDGNFSYAYSKYLSVSFGYTSSDSILQSNGYQRDLDVFNLDKAVFYLGLSSQFIGV